MADDLPKRDRTKAAERMAERRQRDTRTGFGVGNDNHAERRNRDGGPVGPPSEGGWAPDRSH